MINFNGELQHPDTINLTSENRAFKYGDAIFETVKVIPHKVIFWEDHYFRLMSSMRMLRMKIPMEFTLEFLENEILKTVAVHENAISYRVRLNIFRKDGGFYTPKTNKIDFSIQVYENLYQIKDSYSLDVFKDFYNYSGLLSTIKTNNRMLNTLASIFAEENDSDNCILLNEKKQVKTNVIHFQYLPADINGNKVQVTTRLYYDDPLNLNPNKINGSDPINCYVTFSNRDDLSVIELGDRNTQPIVSKYHLETLSVSFNDIIKLKNEKCQF